MRKDSSKRLFERVSKPEGKRNSECLWGTTNVSDLNKCAETLRKNVRLFERVNEKAEEASERTAESEKTQGTRLFERLTGQENANVPDKEEGSMLRNQKTESTDFIECKKPSYNQKPCVTKGINVQLGREKNDANELIHKKSPVVASQISEKTMPCNNFQVTVSKSPKSRRIALSHDTVFFCFENDGLWAVGEEGRVFLGNFALKIEEEKIHIEELVNEANEVTGEARKVVWKMSVLTNMGNFNGWIENVDLLKLNWVQKISDNRAIYDNGSEVKRLLGIYINKLIKAGDYKSITEYASSGWKWRNDETAFFLTSEGAIGYPELPVKAAKGFNLLTRSVSESVAFTQFMNMREIIGRNVKNAILLQYYSLVALLTSLFKKSGNQVEFCVAVIGKTNTKKTSCGEVFSRIFNRTQSAVPDISFSATEAAIYEVMDKYADQIVMIDDMTPSENEVNKREKQKKLENIIRSYGDRVPRRRVTIFSVNRNAKEFTPITGCALLTGEVFSGGKSSRSRVIILRFEEGDVDDEILSYYQRELWVLPTFAYYFLQYVTQELKGIMDLMKYQYAEIRRTMKGRLSLPRSVDAYCVFHTITEVFLKYVVEKNLMDRERVKELIDCDRDKIFEIICENDNELRTVSPAATMMQALKEATESGRVQVKNINKATCEEDLANVYLEDDNYFYISSENLWKCAKIYTDYRRIYFPYSCGRDIIVPLKEADLLLIKEEGKIKRASHKLTMHGKVLNRRFLFLFKDKVTKIWEDLEEY